MELESNGTPNKIVFKGRGINVFSYLWLFLVCKFDSVHYF